MGGNGRFQLGDYVKIVGPMANDAPGERAVWQKLKPKYDQVVGLVTNRVLLKHDTYEIDGDNTEIPGSWLRSATESEVQDYERAALPKESRLHSPGAKDDAAKPPVALVHESFPNALLEVARVADYGAKKYTRGGWKHVSEAQLRYADALARHELAQYSEGDTDGESGLLHLTHMAWNALALLELRLIEK